MLAFDVDGAVFQLHVHLCEVFSDNAEAEKDKSANDEKENNDRGISGNIDAEAELLNDNEYHICHREECGSKSDESNELKGRSGEGDDASHSIAEELSRAPFCFSVLSFCNLIGDIFSIKSDPAENAL